MFFISFLLLNLFVVQIAEAKLEGDYDLLSGSPEDCPSGVLQTKVTDKKTGERVLLFGSRHTWTMDAKDKSEVKEDVEGGCHYISSYEKSDKKFTSKTTRSHCPSEKENGVIDEELSLAEGKLAYTFSSNTKKFKCIYSQVLSK